MRSARNTSLTKQKRRYKLFTRLIVSGLLVVVLQLGIFFGTLIAGGEFEYIEEYAYNTLVDKTINRRNYLETTFQQIVPQVVESAEKMNQLVANILEKEGASIGDLQENRDLNLSILESSVDTLVELMRRGAVNDVYLMLETGSLYSGDGGGSTAKAALYLRDLDIMTDAGYEDLLMEMGFSSISRQYGIVLDSGWTLHFESDPNDLETYGFYYQTLEAAQMNPELPLEALGHWSRFSVMNRSAAKSLKYTVPLIAQDGTVYGVLGIGLTESTILANLPANDFMNEIACYVMGRLQPDGTYKIVTHSGAAYAGLLGGMDTLRVTGALTENISSFESDDVTLVGSVQLMDLYKQITPYSDTQWAVISVADQASVLTPLTRLVNMLLIAAAISVVVGLIIVFASSRMVVTPMTKAIKTMNASSEYGHVIHFEPSHVLELDQMTDAITQLQINVQDYSSQVSQMIRIADVGLGTFMYDHSRDEVYVGQSLLHLLEIPSQDEDVIMSRVEFVRSIDAKETRQAVSEAMTAVPESDDEDYSREFSVERQDGQIRWMRLTMVNNKNKSIGIMQDITGVIMEKKRIEFERDYDATTGLLNRRAYYQRLADLFAAPEQLKVAAILMLDLDNLKYVNDTYGHDFGDDYIKTAAAALKEFRSYGGEVARLSGDEFNVFLHGYNTRDEIREIIARVRRKLLESSCLLADGSHFNVRASFGISWYPDDAKTYELLMKYADFAMYTVKHSTKGGLAEFDMTVYSADTAQATGLEELKRIIAERRVRYAFQSIVSVQTGMIYGYEALMRPQSTIFQSQLELLRTAKTGEELYAIERLTWVKSFEDFRAQIQAGNIAEGSHIFVNSLSNCALEPEEMEMLEEAYPELLSSVVLEILENENTNSSYNARKMQRMRKWDAQIALDDFGVSYNSGQALVTMQPNIIKIDRSIVSGCDKDGSRRAIISGLVRQARAKQILVLASGVETEDEMKAVIGCGVDLLQGYYLNRPLFEPQPIDEKIVEQIRICADPSRRWQAAKAAKAAESAEEAPDA